MPNSSHEDRVVQTYLNIFTAFSLLSLAASTTVVVPLLRSKRLRSKVIPEIMLYVSVADLVSSTAYVIRFVNFTDPWYCIVQTPLCTLFQPAALFWMTFLTHFLYRIIVNNDRNVKITWFEHAICWGVPTILSLIPPFFVGYGHFTPPDFRDYNERVAIKILQIPCSFEPTPSSPSWVYYLGDLFSFVAYGMWVYICIVIMIVEIILVFAKTLTLGVRDDRLRVRNFLLYPFVLIVTQGFFFFFMLLSTLDSVNFHIPATFFCMTYLHGFFNAITFWVIDTDAWAWFLGQDNNNELGFSDTVSVRLHTVPVDFSSQPQPLSLSDSSISSGQFNGYQDYMYSSTSEHSCSDSLEDVDCQAQDAESDKTR